MKETRDLEGQVGIVTGAARNLGRGIAVMLANRGARLVVHYHAERSRPDAEQTARSIEVLGSEAELVQADLADAGAVGSIVERAFARFGRLDVLINNAGLIIKKPLSEITDKEFDHIFAVNAKAPFSLMRAASSRMNEGGRIVNIATSILGCTFPFYSVYAGSKAPLEHFTRALAKELAGRRITVNTVAPGALDTPFFHGAESPESVEMIKHFAGGLGSVDDVVPTVEFLVSARARWFSGQTVFVNGAFVTR